MSKLSDFLTKQKIHERRIISASKKEEALRPEDRRIRLARRAVRREEKPSEAKVELAKQTSRGGRPVAAPTLSAALKGDAVSSGAKNRITRAVNRILKQRKKSEITRAELF
jgi:hypothetical protein